MKDEIICNQEKEDGGMGVCSFLWGLVGQREEETIGSLLVSTFSAGGVARALRGINNLDCTRLPFFPSDHICIHQVTKLRYMYVYDENEDDDNDDGDNNHNLIKQKKRLSVEGCREVRPDGRKKPGTPGQQPGTSRPASPRCLFLFSLKLSLTQSAKY